MKAWGQCPHCGEMGHDVYLSNGMELFSCPKAPPEKIVAYPYSIVWSGWDNYLGREILLNDFEEWSNYQGE